LKKGGSKVTGGEFWNDMLERFFPNNSVAREARMGNIFAPVELTLIRILEAVRAESREARDRSMNGVSTHPSTSSG
jgi:hypothetical protein